MGVPRPDVQAYFPDYPTSFGCGFFYYINTTLLQNTTYNLSCSITDTDGVEATIDSRYVKVRNIGSIKRAGELPSPHPIHHKPISMNRAGITADNLKNALKETIIVKQMERIEMDLARKFKFGGGDSTVGSALTGYLKRGNMLYPLPVGSTLHKGSGKFYWSTGPAHVGSYTLVFLGKVQRENPEVFVFDVSIRGRE